MKSASKKFEIVGRSGVSCILIPVTENEYRLDLVGSRHYKMGGFAEVDDRTGISFVDPAGGPFIEVDTSLNCYHKDLPDKMILSIKDTLDSGILITIE